MLLQRGGCYFSWKAGNIQKKSICLGILTQCHGNDVNSCGCERATIFRFLFLIYDLCALMRFHET